MASSLSRLHSQSRSPSTAERTPLSPQLRRLMPAEACPGPRGAPSAEGEGCRAWVVPGCTESAALSARRDELLQPLGAAYSVNTASPSTESAVLGDTDANVALSYRSLGARLCVGLASVEVGSSR